ncbi:hypothetical protein QL285_028631 [Trifolium repens]|nr:hypothetical protein QL285_028631 [Trifolium repens]
MGKHNCKTKPPNNIIPYLSHKSTMKEQMSPRFQRLPAQTTIPMLNLNNPALQEVIFRLNSFKNKLPRESTNLSRRPTLPKMLKHKILYRIPQRPWPIFGD